MTVSPGRFLAELLVSCVRISRPADAVILAEVRDITDAFEGYGYRRVGAELRHRGFIVKSKKVRRLMQENDLNPRRHRRFVRTTDSDYDGPILPFHSSGFEVHGPDELWVIISEQTRA